MPPRLALPRCRIHTLEASAGTLLVHSSRPWSIVLAGGDGTRLRRLTTIPKQYCSLGAGPSLLRMAFARAERVCPRDRITTVVAEQHRDWWKLECNHLPGPNVVVQPRNCGTAPGVLLPLLAILLRDAQATVVLFPSDHFVADEGAVESAVRQGLAYVEWEPEKLVLLGMAPDDGDSAFGWIVPEVTGDSAIRPVLCFVEKPEPAVAAGLLERGGLWNSFILVARGQALLDLYEQRQPRLAAALGAESAAVAYETLASTDFSRDVLEGAEERLAVVPVGPCGWSDLGTPERVARCTGQFSELLPAASIAPQPL